MSEAKENVLNPIVRWCPNCKAKHEHRLNGIGMIICEECGVDNT